MTPEEKARQKIDEWLEEAGWTVIDRDQFEADMSAVAIRELPTNGNLRTDYTLLLDGKAVGVLEAKKEEVDVSQTMVSEQVATYGRKGPKFCPSIDASKPLPFLYKSNGKMFLFQNFWQSNTRWDDLDRMHSPKKVAEMLGLNDPFVGLPILKKKGLRDCQYEAVTALERSFKAGEKRALMVLATGAGKTYTACTVAYRMLAYTPMKRILFLVDRNNLGRQAENEFGTYKLTKNGDPFNQIYAVNRLHSCKIPSDSNVVISTIQRLFSLLKGEEINDTDDDDADTADTEMALPENPMLPRNFFDLIVIDECHRSIYGNWKKVLEYFDSARLIGLTATPIPETEAFFNKNRVVNYTYEQSILDGVNVDSRIFRIKTKESESGGAITLGQDLRETSKYTGETKDVKSQDCINYTEKELNRSIINPSQIKLILETFRDVIYSQLFDEREENYEYIPKTLIFALNENHAYNIVKIAREVFAEKCPEADMKRYVQSITYSSGDSNELIRQFRNDRDFRIAVTCTLVATGTDVKPLEVVMFMRDVQSAPLYTQMKGRGVRTISDDQLQAVTPNAISKDCYFLVDCVGVTEHTMKLPEPGDDLGEKPVSLKILLERIAHGELPDKYLRRLASVLSSINKKATNEQKIRFRELAGVDMIEIAKGIFDALESNNLPPYEDNNKPNVERKALVVALANHADARQYLLELAAGYVRELKPGSDELISASFSVEEAQSTTEAFETYCRENTDKIEALRIIYNKTGEPINYAMLKDLEEKMKLYNNRFSINMLWNSYEIVKMDAVRKNTKKEEVTALTNLIQLVRFAYHQTERLECLLPSMNQFFNLWHGRKQMEITEAQKGVMREILEFIATNGACTVKEIKECKGQQQAVKLIQAFGNKDKANEALASVFRFVVMRETA